MKTLHLIRHAKSSWADSSLSDIERPLNKRGIQSCEIMARQITKAGCDFKHVFCSVATRAISTIELISLHLTEYAISWQLIDTLYTFDSDDLLTWCGQLDDTLSSVVIVGHNPAITDFCNTISDSDISNVPTCGYVQLTYDGHCWSNLSRGTTILTEYITPKMLNDS